MLVAKRKTELQRRLFHGTDSDTIDKICKNGFNRSYAGRNGEKNSYSTDFRISLWDQNRESVRSKLFLEIFSYTGSLFTVFAHYCLCWNQTVRPEKKTTLSSLRYQICTSVRVLFSMVLSQYKRVLIATSAGPQNLLSQKCRTW